jgi:hypothetical protein
MTAVSADANGVAQQATMLLLAHALPKHTAMDA